MADGATDVQALRAAADISHADEKRIALELSPDIAWPTLALAVLLPTSFAGLVWLALSGAVPAWALTPVLALISYAHYSLVHESIHGNVVAKPKSLAWVNTLVGWVGSLGMGAGWPALQRTHVLHHSHTNTERDPDIFVKGTFWQLVRKWLMSSLTGFIPLFALKYINAERYRRLGTILSPADIAQVSAVTVGQLALLTAAAATGHLLDWALLWFIPTKLAILILNVFFQWLPHHPFDRTERYLNTRISLWAGGTLVLLQQNLHLMHHLWPSVPFYNYARLFRRLRLVLIAEGSRIEGLRVGPKARRLAA